MKRTEAVTINYRVGNMILTIQREFWADYKIQDWLHNTKMGRLYTNLCNQRDELSDYILSVIED